MANFADFPFHAVSILRMAVGGVSDRPDPLPRGPKRCLGSDSSAGRLGVAPGRPGPEQHRDLIGARRRWRDPSQYRPFSPAPRVVK